METKVGAGIVSVKRALMFIPVGLAAGAVVYWTAITVSPTPLGEDLSDTVIKVIGSILMTVVVWFGSRPLWYVRSKK